MTRVRAVAALGVVLWLAACASVAPSGTVRDVKEIAGTWRGRVTGPRGHAVTTLTIAESGVYQGTMHLDGEDRDFTGRILMIGPGQMRYGGEDGHGSVQVEERGRRLRFVHDGGGAGGVFRPLPPVSR